jgi:UDP-GlcNAc:undecaprenyl-phosphate GlcNAc-1-phosphate transferase
MFMFILISVVAVVSALLVTPVLRKVFVYYGVVDRPDGYRKLHCGAIPRVGGMVIATAYFASFGAYLVAGAHLTFAAAWNENIVLRLSPAVAVVFLVGLCDDLFRLRAWLKLTIQVVAAGLAVWAGLRVDALFYHPVGFGVGITVTVFWLALCTNAFNLIDGMDGLASGIGLFSTLTVLCVGLWTGNDPLVFATIPLAGALFGFLYYNFNPASVFLGDSGSYTIGFLLGCFGLIWYEKSTTALGMLAPALAFSVPLLDVWLSVVRRFLRMKPLFEPDHGHIHHKMLARGLTPRRVAIALYGLTVLSATLALMLSFGHQKYGGIVITTFCLLILGTIGAIGYEELKVTLVLLHPNEFRRVLNGRLKLQSAEERLRSAQNPAEKWTALETICSELGFCKARIEGPRGELKSFTHTTPRSEIDCCANKCGSCRRSCTVSTRIDGETILYLSYKLGVVNQHQANIIPLIALVSEWLVRESIPRESVAVGRRDLPVRMHPGSVGIVAPGLAERKVR